jgi:F-type H+-transporting ATPase subunit b
MIDLDGTFFLQMAIFFALFAVLYTALFKPLMGVFDARESAIDGAKQKSRELEVSAEEKFQRFETEMKKVRIEATQERDRVRQDALNLERELLSKSRAEADKMMKEADATLTQEGAKVRAEILASAPQLASDIAERLLGRRAN